MKKILPLLIIILLGFNTFAQKEISSKANNPKFKSTYKRVSIPNPSSFTLKLLDQNGIDLTCGVTLSETDLKLELNDSELDRLKRLKIDYTILINDLEKFYSQRAIEDLPMASIALEKIKSNSKTNKSTGLLAKGVTEIINNVGQYVGENEIDWAVPANWKLNDATSYPGETNHFGGCLTYDMVVDELDLMKSKYPNLISTKANASPSNQLTHEGKTVWMVRISDNPETDEPSEPETLYQSLIHSREAATVMNQLYFMWYLLENYDSDPAIKNLVNNQALYFVPVFNPDGFVYNQTMAPNGGGGQRKNRNTSAGGGCSTYLHGIDLNRNSAYYWGNGGSSTLSCNDTYMGTAPFSENETQIMRDFFLQHDFKIALNHHSYKNAMLHAYAGVNQTNPRPDEYSKYNHDMSFYNRYMHGPSTNVTSLNSGNMNDWMLGGPSGTSANGTPTGTGSGKNTMAWTPENGLSSEGTGGTYGGFWPAPSNFLPIAKRAMRMNLLAAYFSGKYAKLHDLNQSSITTTSGNLKFAIENLGQTSSDFTLTVTPISTNITITGSPNTQSGMTILQQKEVTVGYTLDAGIQPNDKIEYKVTLSNNYASDNVLYEATIEKYYQPLEIFSDNPDADNLTNWSGTWGITTDSYSGNAITASTTIPYAANQTKILQLNGSVDLTSVSEALVQFYAKWDLERSFDYVQLEGSTDGTNWIPLKGKYTKPGAPNANNNYSNKSLTSDNFQPDGEQLYDGDSQDKWIMEEIVIDATTNSFLFNSNTAYFRFEFKTEGDNRNDTYYNMDFEGFTFDDFKITGIEIPCVASIPTNISSSGIATTEATINWDNIPSATFDLIYRETGTTTWSDTIDLNTNSNTITGLSALTEYEVQVRSKCDATNSNYSDSHVFTTTDISYCLSSGSTSILGISLVSFNSISNADTSYTSSMKILHSNSTDVYMGTAI